MGDDEARERARRRPEGARRACAGKRPPAAIRTACMTREPISSGRSFEPSRNGQSALVGRTARAPVRLLELRRTSCAPSVSRLAIAAAAIVLVVALVAGVRGHGRWRCDAGAGRG
ncbi:MAG: hypothetical protein ACLTMP_01665 [Eggerthella lenta]